MPNKLRLGISASQDEVCGRLSKYRCGSKKRRQVHGREATEIKNCVGRSLLRRVLSLNVFRSKGNFGWRKFLFVTGVGINLRVAHYRCHATAVIIFNVASNRRGSPKLESFARQRHGVRVNNLSPSYCYIPVNRQLFTMKKTPCTVQI